MGRMASDAEFGFWADWPLLKLDLPGADIPLSTQLRTLGLSEIDVDLLSREPRLEPVSK